MYDDSWFQPLIQPTPARTESSHKRRVSLLKQPNVRHASPTAAVLVSADTSQEDDQVDAAGIDVPSTIHEPPSEPTGPPKAFVARRAASYSDFYHAVRAQLKEEKEARHNARWSQRRERRRSQVEDSVLHEVDDQYDAVAEQLLDSSHDKYKLYLDQLHASRAHLDSLIQDTDSNLGLLATLSASFNTVEAHADAFQARCDTLLAEQKRMSTLADDISHNLQFYSYLDPITRRLNAPGVRHFVRGDDFSQMLAQLDDCLAYMEAHPNHKESAAYLSRYRLLLTRGLTLIRVYFTNTISETAADVSKRIADRQLNDTTMPALLYAKFRVHAPELKRLAREIQSRAAPAPGSEPGAQGEYQSLVNELHQSYSAARGRLIIPLTRKKLAEMDLAPSTSKDLVSFARSSISYMRGVCLDEYELWHEWFDTDEGIYDFLEAVCEPLYDYLRPKTIRETQLPKLCELCNLLQVQPLDQEDEEMEVPEKQQLDFQGLITSALEDAQTRLVFLALSILRNDIERFAPKPEDLNYPAKNKNVALSGKKSKEPVLSGKKDAVRDERLANAATVPDASDEGLEDHDLKWRSESGAFHSWYPTLQKAIWLLSKIYRLVNSTVFDDLAHQIVHQTTLSLVRASEQIGNRATPADRQLFLLKQLLTLKQQIVAFDIEFVTPEVDVDFSSLTNTFWELRERGTLFDPRHLVRLLGSNMIPRVVENMLDAKSELDARLRAVITDFTNTSAARMTAPVAEAAAAAAKDFDAAGAVRAVRTAVERDAPLVRAKLDEYIDDFRTRETLAGAVQDQVLANYDDFFDRYVAKAREAGGAPLSMKGKGRQDDVWDPDTFADWTIDVFGVSNGDAGGADEHDGVGSSPALSRVTSA